MSIPAATDAYDVILIGSGMGALTVASLLSQLRGQRVLILERHFKPGGFTHDFTRGRFHWDVGLHYVGDMAPSDRIRGLFDLITRGGVTWRRMPEPFERFLYPDFCFDVYADPARFEADLCDRFPSEVSAIRRYFRDIQQTAHAFTSVTLHDNAQIPLRWAFGARAWWNGRHLDDTTRSYLDTRFRDPLLRAVLASQWGDYGLPPGQSSFAVHSVIANHYLRGAYYPTGGAGTIAESVQVVVEAAGGKVIVNREVTEILVENGRAVGVRACKRSRENRGAAEEYRAPVIVSNAGAATTFLRLLPDSTPIPFRARLAEFVRRYPPATNVSLFVGLSGDPRRVGVHGGNVWIYSDLDHDGVFARRREALERGRPEQVYVSFPSLKDPSAQAHTAELITFADYNQFARWKDQPWRRKDADYQNLKDRIADGLVSLVDSRLPGFADLVEFRELATPLTNAYFTAHAGGGIYGLSAVPERFAPANAAWRRAETPVPGLYMTGADQMVGGIVSAMISGIMTLNALPGGVPFREAFAAANNSRRGNACPL